MMEIQAVKYLGDGFLVNEILNVPNDEGNRHYQMVQKWITEGGIVEPEFTAEELAIQARVKFKSQRAELVEQIKVTTTAGNIFDGDETSQTRMARAISVMTDTDTTLWVLANNTPLYVTKAELMEALKLAGEAQTAIWIP